MLRVAERFFDGRLIKHLWDGMSPLPGGRLAFSKAVGLLAPYTGSIGAVVMDLGPGRARVQLKERWGLRNPFRSLHAVALTNLGELASGLSLIYGLPSESRAIIVKLETEYTKKARGLITAICHTEPALAGEERQVRLIADLRDEVGDRVAKVTATWLVRPKA